MSGLTLTQKSALIGCHRAPPNMFKPRRVVTQALVRKGYATETRTGAIKLTEKGIKFAEHGVE